MFDMNEWMTGKHNGSIISRMAIRYTPANCFIVFQGGMSCYQGYVSLQSVPVDGTLARCLMKEIKNIFKNEEFQKQVKLIHAQIVEAKNKAVNSCVDSTSSHNSAIYGDLPYMMYAQDKSLYSKTEYSLSKGAIAALRDYQRDTSKRLFYANVFMDVRNGNSVIDTVTLSLYGFDVGMPAPVTLKIRRVAGTKPYRYAIDHVYTSYTIKPENMLVWMEDFLENDK